ncbi:hypothetical protein [Parvularcula lutaonensis]|uniref:Uncharacterized protein n=1 Tax=Parvularcula lutaonensis TaxID=491923 RepID=A0ABV7M7Q1_9PROT|nr:hypothetical protein [Parvularcula lutaonensis]GGY42002.1 hypothetical protein GCM10007148_08290 [Parvularcula lutaonensis]
MSDWPTGHIPYATDLSHVDLVNALRLVRWLAVPELAARSHGCAALVPDQGTAITLFIEMIDIEERLEVGRLNVGVDSCIASLCAEKIPLPEGDRSITELISVEEHATIESGIEILWEQGQKMTIVPNAMPCSLAIAAPGFPDRYFEPEYALSDYAREELP